LGASPRAELALGTKQVPANPLNGVHRTVRSSLAGTHRRGAHSHATRPPVLQPRHGSGCIHRPPPVWPPTRIGWVSTPTTLLIVTTARRWNPGHVRATRRPDRSQTKRPKPRPLTTSPAQQTVTAANSQGSAIGQLSATIVCAGSLRVAALPTDPADPARIRRNRIWRVTSKVRHVHPMNHAAPEVPSPAASDRHRQSASTPTALLAGNPLLRD
jgi:hypothetical protein